MTEAFLQIVTLLAYLAIGLIAVAFPLYAIAVNFFPQEKWEGEKQRKKTIEELRRTIKEDTKKLKKEFVHSQNALDLKKKIEKYTTELKTQESRSLYLTAENAVGMPVLCLTVSLALSALGIYYYYAEFAFEEIISYALTSVLLIGPIFFIVIASVMMYKTITSVESAALVTERTVDYDIGFNSNFAQAVTIELGKENDVAIGARTNDFDIENRCLSIKYPKDLGLQVTKTDTFIYGEVGKMDCISAFKDFVPKGFSLGIWNTLLPSKQGKFTIIVTVSGKGLTKCDHELTVIVKQANASLDVVLPAKMKET